MSAQVPGRENVLTPETLQSCAQIYDAHSLYRPSAPHGLVFIHAVRQHCGGGGWGNGCGNPREEPRLATYAYRTCVLVSSGDVGNASELLIGDVYHECRQ